MIYMRNWVKGLITLVVVVMLTLGGAVDTIQASPQINFISVPAEDTPLPVYHKTSATDAAYGVNPYGVYAKKTAVGYTVDMDTLRDDLIIALYKSNNTKPLKERAKFTYVYSAAKALITFRANNTVAPSEKNFSGYYTLLEARQEAWKALAPTEKLKVYAYFTDAAMEREFTNISGADLYALWEVSSDEFKIYMYDTLGFVNTIADLFKLKGLTTEQKANLLIDADALGNLSQMAQHIGYSRLNATADAEVLEYLRTHDQLDIIYEIVDTIGDFSLYYINDYLIDTYGYYLEDSYGNDALDIPSSKYGK
jgi:hypothetical protein